jgi:hypothetical protein
MRNGHYSVIQYIADPARNEPLNIGAVVWDDREFRLRVDDQAVQRVIRDHPKLTRDALLYVQPMLQNELREACEYGIGQLTEALTTRKAFPVAFSEPRFTAIDDNAGLDANLDRLIGRVVRPKRRVGGTTFDPTVILDRRLRPLINQRLVYPAHVFERSRSGVPRSVDFFANSTANVAIDTVRLAVTKGAEIVHRADAEAFKVEDIRIQNPGLEFVVYCHFSQEVDVQDANDRASKIIRSVGATVVTDIEDAAERIETAVSRRR